MADRRRYKNVQNGHIVGPLTATEAKQGLAGLDDGEWEAEGDEPGTWGEKPAPKARKPRKAKADTAADTPPAVENESNS